MFGLSRNNRLIALALFLWATGEGLFVYIQPLYIKKLGADPGQIGAVLSLAGLALALAYLPGGILSDRISRKAILVAGWGLGILAVLLMAAARDWRTFIPGIMLYSFSAFCIPATSALAADSAGDLPIERVITLVYSGYWAGSIVSPWVGGWIAQLTSMRLVYICSASAFSVSLMVVLMIRAPAQPRDVRIAPSTLALPSWRLSGVTGLLVFAIFLALFIGQPLAPNYIESIAGWPVERIGFLGSLNALGTTLLAPALGRLGERRRQQGIWTAQALVWGSFLLLLVGVRWVPILLPVAFMMRGGYTACRSLIGAQAAGQAAPENRGAAFGLVETSVASAQMVAPFLAGQLFKMAPDAPVWAGLALAPLMMLLSPRLARLARASQVELAAGAPQPMPR